jgi:hypothetical protein
MPFIFNFPHVVGIFPHDTPTMDQTSTWGGSSCPQRGDIIYCGSTSLQIVDLIFGSMEALEECGT